ncbi:MAG: pyridoxamine 5'-phosphate oxidase family protein [Balneolaceae bacterium]|nr:pyridoxamine 5'-phosphate oxidase family protein [Balneolaceae bacterium]MBO6547183.1 pyridoxamine 5'-phosphate oxidase family protein [Balneolaceae bacterium]MBO6647870.1 pyridoxamine 5'-phosphate oxidase family protein [Balneolaceae bacterium]
MISETVKEYIDSSVLCWLATSSASNHPNVSPKEVFTWFDNETLIIANIASPGSATNVLKNPNVAVSFVDVFAQKGYQLKGKCKLVERSDSDFNKLATPLEQITKGLYPFDSIFRTEVKEVKEIKAPGYFAFPDKTEADMIDEALKMYGVKL